MAVVRQLVLTLENRPGALAELTSALARVAVNIQAIAAPEAGPLGAVRLLVAQPETARKVLGELGLKWVEEDALAVRLTDRPGALGRVLRRLAGAGLQVNYLYGTIEKGSRRALVIVGVSDLARAARLVR